MYDGATRGLGMQTMMTEMSLSPQLKMVRISTDSSVAKSFVATRGLGKMRHFEVKFLWLQETVQMGKVRVEKVSGATNIADALTKYHVIDKLDALCRPHGIVSWRCSLGTESGLGGKNHRAEVGCDENPTSGRAKGNAQTLGCDTWWVKAWAVNRGWGSNVRPLAPDSLCRWMFVCFLQLSSLCCCLFLQ